MGLVKLECLLQVEVEGAVETVYAAIALRHLAIIILQVLLELLLHLRVSHQGFEALADACIGVRIVRVEDKGEVVGCHEVTIHVAAYDGRVAGATDA